MTQLLSDDAAALTSCPSKQLLISSLTSVVASHNRRLKQ